MQYRGGTKQFLLLYHQKLLLLYYEISIYHKVKFCFSTKSPSLLTHFFHLCVGHYVLVMQNSLLKCHI